MLAILTGVHCKAASHSSQQANRGMLDNVHHLEENSTAILYDSDFGRVFIIWALQCARLLQMTRRQSLVSKSGIKMLCMAKIAPQYLSEAGDVVMQQPAVVQNFSLDLYR